MNSSVYITAYIDLMHHAMTLIASDKIDAAVDRLAEAAAHDASKQLPSYLQQHLQQHWQRRATGKVYENPAAFQAFIAGGGNKELYSGVIDFLRANNPAGFISVVDFGCGDAKVTAELSVTENIVLVEPSASLLNQAKEKLASKSIRVESHCMTAQAFLNSASPDKKWQTALWTFSMQCVNPSDRLNVLRSLKARFRNVYVAEFDVPTTRTTRERIISLIERYEIGISEYTVDRDLVARDFLMPMLISQITANEANRLNWEQPMRAWEDDFRVAGFSHVTAQTVAKYWWADCFVLVAS
jgi:ubiquinone/menaquinone biosynthesis C-methylase UbiE